MENVFLYWTQFLLHSSVICNNISWSWQRFHCTPSVVQFGLRVQKHLIFALAALISIKTYILLNVNLINLLLVSNNNNNMLNVESTSSSEDGEITGEARHSCYPNVRKQLQPNDGLWTRVGTTPHQLAAKPQAIYLLNLLEFVFSSTSSDIRTSNLNL